MSGSKTVPDAIRVTVSVSPETLKLLDAWAERTRTRYRRPNRSAAAEELILCGLEARMKEAIP